MKDAPDEHVHALPRSRLSPLLEDVIPTLLVPDVIEQLLHRTLADVITATPRQSPTVNPTAPRDEHNCPRVRR